jgi:hypothetical protein
MQARLEIVISALHDVSFNNNSANEISDMRTSEKELAIAPITEVTERLRFRFVFDYEWQSGRSA